MSGDGDRAPRPVDRPAAGTDATATSAKADASAPAATSAKADETRALIRSQSRRGGFGGGRFRGAGMPAEKSQNFLPSALRLVGTLRPEAWPVAAVIVVGVLSILASVLGPAALGRATDLVWNAFIGHRTIDFAALGQVLLTVIGLYAVSSGFGWVQAFVLNGITQRTVLRMRRQVEDKLHRLPLSYFDRMQRGELLSRVTNDIDNISQSLQQTLSQILTSLLTIIGVATMMIVLSPPLALVALLTIPLTIIVTTLVAKRSQGMFIAQWSTTGRLNAQVEEAFSGHALVRVFGRRGEVETAFDAENRALYSSSFGAQFVSGLIQPSMTFIGNLVYVAIAVVGGFMVTSGSLSIGAVQAFIQYARQFTQPLAQLGSMANLLQSGVASAERVFDLLDAEEQLPDPAAPDAPEAQTGRLDFEHVAFAYTPENPLITDLSLTARPGQSIAIVGPSGAGKTTLVNLIMRFYELDSGRITLDGVDITTMSRTELRSRMGMVLQETWLFTGTIRENLLYGRPDATEEEMLAAADAAHVDRFVRRLPDGYDTILDDEASSLSAGEKQLVTIARAMIADPSVLILDEATSSVDTRTELLLQQAMTALRGGRTSFIIAHRLSTIRDADLILVMEHGDIVEQGTHDELVVANGAYARLYDAQFNSSRTEDDVAQPARTSAAGS